MSSRTYRAAIKYDFLVFLDRIDWSKKVECCSRNLTPAGKVFQQKWVGDPGIFPLKISDPVFFWHNDLIATRDTSSLNVAPNSLSDSAPAFRHQFVGVKYERRFRHLFCPN